MKNSIIKLQNLVANNQEIVFVGGAITFMFIGVAMWGLAGVGSYAHIQLHHIFRP